MYIYIWLCNGNANDQPVPVLEEPRRFSLQSLMFRVFIHEATCGLGHAVASQMAPDGWRHTSPTR